jgi:hypothetical protein
MMPIKNPVTRQLSDSTRRRLELSKRLQVVTGRLLTIAYERGELREILDLLRREGKPS